MELVREVSYPYQPYALAYQGAVLIELVDAVVADGAVGASWRAVDLAGLAELQPDLHTIDGDEPGSTCSIFFRRR